MHQQKANYITSQDKAVSMHRSNNQQFEHMQLSSNSTHIDVEKIIHNNLLLLESKMAFLKLNKNSMTAQEIAQTKTDIRAQTAKIKLYQRSIAHITE